MGEIQEACGIEDNVAGDFLVNELQSIPDIVEMLSSMYKDRDSFRSQNIPISALNYRMNRFDERNPKDLSEETINLLLDYYNDGIGVKIRQDLSCRLVNRMRELATSNETDFNIYKEDILRSLGNDILLDITTEEDWQVFGLSKQEVISKENEYGREGLIFYITKIDFESIHSESNGN